MMKIKAFALNLNNEKLFNLILVLKSKYFL